MSTLLLILLILAMPDFVLISYSLSLLLIHNADMHSQFEQFPGPNQKNIGGFGRTLTAIKYSRSFATKHKMEALYLNAGDTFVGSLWYKVHGWEIAADFMKLLNPNITSLGINDFDQSLTNLSRYIRAVGCPVVCTNADFSKEPELAELIRSSYVFTIDNVKIGVVGYLTPKTETVMNIGKIKFFSEITSLKQKCIELKSYGVNFIIALGHSGYTRDVQIAKKVSDIDVIIGGYSHTLLWNGRQPHTDIPIGNYPQIVEQSHEKKALILHSGSHTKYLGRITLNLNHLGVLKSFIPAIAFMKGIKQDKAVLTLLKKYRPPVDQYKKTVIGKSNVLLSCECVIKECNFGNMITDAFIEYMAAHKDQNSGRWSECGMAILNGGAVNSQIPPGNITIEQIYTALPKYYRLVSFDIKGKNIMKLFQASIDAKFHKKNEFLQVSGFRVFMDPEVKAGDRLLYVLGRCIDCVIPRYSNLVLMHTYRLITTDYLFNGNAGFEFLTQKATNVVLHKIYDVDVVIDYIKVKRVVRPEINDRFSYYVEQS